jgi:cell surface protein SprA
LPNEYTLNPQLGYISLQQRLANDEILAIAYEYTIGSEVYQVGEFGNNGVEGTQAGANDPNTGQPESIISQTLILKMLKSNLTDVQEPIWGLMMKNIYQIPGAYQVEKEDFRFNINYVSQAAINFITPVEGTPFPPNPAPGNQVEDTPLLNVFNLDKLNYNNDPQTGGDGFFDYIQGLTFDSQNGRIIFTTVEPFGKLLFEKLRLSPTENYYGDPNSLIDYNDNQRKYVFKNLYYKTQTAALQEADKNKFQIKGKYKSVGGEGIPIGAYNVPQGSVVVTAGGRVLIEGVDYSVNYQAGRVIILDPSLQASNIPIEVSVENNAVFGQQTRRFMGVLLEQKISDNFIIGGTVLNLLEKPLTQKSSYGQDSVNNTIFGISANYSTEVPFFTRLVNKLPNLDTDVPSNLSFRGEMAYLLPGTPKADNFEGQTTLYIDDFEGSETTIDLRSASAWTLSSTPIKNVLSPYNDFGADANDMSYGYKRAKLNWYSIDPIFYNERPPGVSVDDLSQTPTRRIYSEELYPETQIPAGQSNVVTTLDLTYYPQERGPYNNNPFAAGTNLLPNPKDNFGGIVRGLNTTNFEQANVEYVQLWVLDPYVGFGALPSTSTNKGKIFIDFGSISEDVLKDGRKQFENGLPEPNSTELVHNTIWGIVPASQSLVYAFDTNEANRAVQDVGLDGISDAQEATIYNNFASLPDPAADNYVFFLDAVGSVIERYRNYNGTQSNSPIAVSETDRGNSTLPDTEDVNRDSTMDGVNGYFEYSIDIEPGVNVGTTKYVTNIMETIAPIPGSSFGETTPARWIQYKIPITQFENKIGPISDFRSIRFARMFMTGFDEPITVRFGSLELVRGDWIRYNRSLDPLESDVENILDGTRFDQEALNIYEDADRTPIPYVSPPDVQREQIYVNNTVIYENEQSIALSVSGTGLEPADSRAIFKNVSLDMRQYNNLNMFLHAESIPGLADPLADHEMVAFIRLGNDLTENFYQIEIPLQVTASGTNSPDLIWPEGNEINVAFDLLTQIKLISRSYVFAPGEIFYMTESELNPNNTGNLRIGIRGNPNLGFVRNILLGIKNNTKDGKNADGTPLTEKDISGSVWFNELRMSDMDNKGGMAAVANVETNLADFANISATGRMSTIGFGTLEDGPQQRSREDIQQYNIVTNLSLGKLLPKKWGINLPFNYGIAEETATPEYDPYNQDIKLDQVLDYAENQEEKDLINNRAIDFTKRKSINFIGVKKERAEQQIPKIYDPENLTLSYSYNEVEKHNYEVENYIEQQVVTNLNYGYSFQPKYIEPLKKNAYLKKNNYWKLLSDFNFNFLPSNLNFNTGINRQYNKQQFRQVDIVGIQPSPLYKRNYLFNYQYGFNFNLSKSLKINYTASSSNIITNYLNENNDPINDISLWSDYWSTGEANQRSQQLVLNYDIPIDKIPVFSFIKANYSYTGDYNWTKASLALTNLEIDGQFYNLGNTIQNASLHKLNSTLNMETFYKYIGIKKGAKKPAAKPAVAPKPGEKITQPNAAPAKSSNVFVDGLIGVLTSVKNIQVNYSEGSGTVLPGYTPGIGFLGTSKPTIGFVFGSQSDVRYDAARSGWLTNYPEFNSNYTQVNTEVLNYTANIDLFPDLKIDLNADRLQLENYSEQYDVIDGQYNSRSPYSFGNYSISTILIGTSFNTSDEFYSAAFDNMVGNRIVIANRLAESFYGPSIPRYGDAANPIPAEGSPNYAVYVSNEGYPIGFGKNNQSVLLPSFLAAYSGKSAESQSLDPFKSFPVPNWTLKYTGLMRYKFFKDAFKRFSILNGYRASYTINSYRSNFDYTSSGYLSTGALNTDAGGNIYNQLLMSNVNLIEQFNPLVKFDFEMKNSVKFIAGVIKDRALSLSFDNNLVTEVKGIEYVVGFGYRIKDVVISTKLADNPTGVVKSDINIKFDFSYRDNQTIVRNLDYNNNQLSGGQNVWSAKLTADYNFSKNLTAIFYYDQSFSKAVISTSFPISNVLAGFTIRYNFGN